ncbi:basic leucine zipper 43-like [Prosopis cineraria]|uniref:basic leucine zipper 43-like n=1 Tax=Prosopis cineraria TaxID=364024 RepID=UPI00240FADA0|nr:basic leucine zipper 43-like [Prosopis cineraria]
MIPTKIRGTSDNPFLTPQNITTFLPNNLFSNFDITSLLGSTHHHHLLLSELNNNLVPSSSTSDEAEEKQTSMIDERKQRRMISNRESARRSRMRKQRHIDELWSQVVRLRTENHNLVHRLNHVSESHDRVLQENAKLREEASDLRQMVADLQIGSPFANTLADFDDFSDF